MTLCVYRRCLSEVDESNWHIEVAIGVMHPNCYELYVKDSTCVWCHKFVDVASKNAVSYENRFYHASCLDEKSLSRQGIQVQLALNFGEM